MKHNRARGYADFDEWECVGVVEEIGGSDILLLPANFDLLILKWKGSGMNWALIQIEGEGIVGRDSELVSTLTHQKSFFKWAEILITGIKNCLKQRIYRLMVEKDC